MINRQERFINNRKQDKIRLVSSQPSIDSLREGQEVLYYHKNGMLKRYRKQNGKLWSTNMSANGNQIIDKTLTSNKVLANDVTSNVVNARKLIFSIGDKLTIASGAIAPTHSFHLVDTESSASTDDLDTITGGEDGQILIIKTFSGSRDVVVRHDSGNIYTNGEGNITLGESEDTMILIHQDSSWYQILKADSNS